MANSGDANGFSAIGQLVEDSVGADPQRIQTAQFSAKCIADKRIALEEPKRVLDRVDQRPVQFEQVMTGPTGEDESSQGSTGGRPALGQLAAKVGKSDRLAALNLGKTRLQCREGIGIGKDLGGLLQRLVLVYGNESRCVYSWSV